MPLVFWLSAFKYSRSSTVAVNAQAASPMCCYTGDPRALDWRPSNHIRQPVLWVPPTAPESAIERTRPGAEQRARTTATAILTAAQNGTYAFAGGPQVPSEWGSTRHAVSRRPMAVWVP